MTYRTSGKYSALVSIDLHGWIPPHWAESYRSVIQAYVDGAKKWRKERHGLATMQYHWGNPLIPNGTAWLDTPKDAPKVDVGKVATPCTPENRAQRKELRRTADYMQQLAEAHVPILFRSSTRLTADGSGGPKEAREHRRALEDDLRLLG